MISAANPKLIALTFDDGPSGYTDWLLDGLAERDVKVTFFIVGASATVYPDTVRRAYEEGHQIAQHTYDHPPLTTKTDEQIRWQISTTDGILDDILGEDHDYLLRAPYGDCNGRVLSQIGCPNIMWSVDSCDWQLLNAEKVRRQIVGCAFDGAIILVHDIHKTSIPGALDAIDDLLEQGYEFVTVNELFRRRGEKLTDGYSYSQCKPNGADYGALEDPTFAITDENITFSDICEGGELRYTTDGSKPSERSKLYEGPLPLYNGTLKFCVFGDGARTRIKTYTVSENGNAFTDVGAKDWYFEAADRAVELGLFHGTGEYRFAPKDNLTRAMFVTVLYRLMEQKGKDITVSGKTSFKDVKKEWCRDAIAWAYENDIVKGYGDKTFRPDQTITREEMCAILDRVLTWLGEERLTGKPEYKDAKKIASWAKAAVVNVSKAGLLQGQSDNTFAPKQTATRAQAATVLLRLYDKLA